MASQHLITPVNFEPKVNNGDRTSPLLTTCPHCRRAGLHTMDPSALVTYCKGSGASFGYQAVLFRLKSVLPDCIQEWYHYGASHCSQNYPAPEEIQHFTETVGISASNLWSLCIPILVISIILLNISITWLKVSLLCTPVTTVPVAKIALKSGFLTPCTLVMCRHFPTKEDTRYLEQFLAGPSSAWSQLHWQGAGLQSPGSQKKQQFNLCVGTRLLLWWIICRAQSQQAGKSQRKLSSTGRFQHTTEKDPQVCPFRFLSQATNSLQRRVSQTACKQSRKAYLLP